MSFPQGIAFRATAGFVTDGANDFFAGTSNYPTTSTQGNTVGFEAAAAGSADRNSGIDVRLAGENFTNPTQIKYRIDLPNTGNYNVRAAVGDANANLGVYLDVTDTNTSLGPLVPFNAGVGSGNFKDAANTTYSAALWPGSNSVAALSFSSTICRFVIGDGTNLCVCAYVYIESAGGGGGGGTTNSKILVPSNIRSFFYGLSGGLQ